MNLLELPCSDDGLHLGDLVFPVDRSALAAAGERITLGVRSEDLVLADRGLSVEVELVEELGADAYVYASAQGTGSSDNPVAAAPGQAVDADGNVVVVARTDGDSPPAKGEVIRLAPKPGRVHLFHTSSGQRLETHELATSG